jgi:prefoldin subunit 5
VPRRTGANVNHQWGKAAMSETKEDLKQQLNVLTGRRERMQKNLYEVEKEITEITKRISKLKK